MATPLAPLIALHGMKSRWAGPVLSEGLVRSSAAWFLLDDRGPRLDRTLAATVHLSLGIPTCERLATLSRPGAYTELFAEEVGLLPAIVRFDYAPTGAEHTHRYLWLGASEVGTTTRYTNVARAGRRVTFRYGHRSALTTLATVARIEAELDRAGLTTGPARLIEKVEADADVGPVSGSESKLGRFCWEIGRTWRSALNLTSAGSISAVRCAEGVAG
ncbi:hypothetical protein AB0D32_24030 [Micromonospora sp. NPDC048170]|uniref:hypothetical protein n=1 Tax=Micromonospora sp. NPDC048170 TaxID=3154819 RepID=UPI00340BD36F